MMDAMGATWGRLVARYSRAFSSGGRADILCREPLPPSPCFFICWHSASLIAMALHADRPRPVAALTWTPRGLAGSAMRSWLEVLDIEPVPVNEAANIGRVLGTVRKRVAEGYDILIAVDGPSGPRHQVKPAALWLADRSGAEVRGFGCAATPCLRSPRWDRLIVPLPAARIGAVLSAPLSLQTKPRTDRSGASVARILDELDEDAAQLLSTSRRNQMREYAIWK